MDTSENVSEIFSILHDGSITAWVGDRDFLTLIVECEYLAELIDKSFDTFYIELTNIDKIELDPWTTPIDTPSVLKTELTDIFKAKLGILDAEIKGNVVEVVCDQHCKEVNFSGGILTISCERIEIFDQAKNKLTVNQLIEICNRYWNK